MTDALWALGRGTGVVALVMLTVSMVLGIASRSGRPLPGLGRFGFTDLHRTASLTGTALIALHLGTLLLDPYAQLRLVDLIFPFLGSYRPLWLGLGTLAVDVLVIVTVVSMLRHRIGPRVFRAVHWSTYALWPMSVAHTLGDGSDNGTLWLRGLAALCTAAVVAAVGWRLGPSYGERGRARLPRRLPERAKELAP